MKAKPEFTIEIKKGKKILSFLCTYSQDMPDDVQSQEYSKHQIAIINLILHFLCVKINKTYEV